jgi:MtN3 and saliva related transmembrane protein
LTPFDTALAALASAVGIATGAAYLPQAIRIVKRKSSADVSVLSYLLFFGGQAIWLVYGIRFRQVPIVVGMAANMVGNLAVIFAALRYRSVSPLPSATPSEGRSGP